MIEYSNHLLPVVQVRADGGLDWGGGREEGQEWAKEVEALEVEERGTADECWGRGTEEGTDSRKMP